MNVPSELAWFESGASLIEDSRTLYFILETNPHQVFCAQPDGSVDYVNSNVREYTGASSEELAGSGWAEFVHPEDRERAQRRWQEAISSGNSFAVDLRLRRHDGEYRWHQATAKPFRDADGRILRWFGVSTDVHDVHATVIERDTRAAEMQKLFDTAPAFIAISEDPECKSVRVNGKFAELLGVRPSTNTSPEGPEAPTLKFAWYSGGKFLVPEDLPQQVAGRTNLPVEDVELEVRFDDGRPSVFLFGSAAPIRDNQGRVRGTVAAYVDVTERKLASEALLRAEKLATAGRLAASIAHEVNNPLEAITNLLYLLRREVASEEGRRYLDMAESELARTSTIARKTLGFYRDSMQSRVPVSKVVGDAIDVFRSRLDSLGIDARVELEEAGHLEVPGDTAQVLINLLGNAIDASEAGQPVRIWAGEREGSVSIDVEDEGAGVPEELRERIFEPFFTTKRTYGTGLGLWVSREIVEAHGGSLRVASGIEGNRRVTRFSVLLPKTAGAAKSMGV